MSSDVELVADYACHTGENPLWHPEQQCLYWTDIPNGRLFRYDPAEGAHAMCHEGRPVGGFTLEADGALLLFMDRGSVARWRDGAIEDFVIEEIADERSTRFNDVIADPAGRVFCGTMRTEQRLGRLYRLDPDGTISLVLENLGTPNGMGFPHEGGTFLQTDTKARTIYRFAYDRGTGALTDGTPFIEVPSTEGEGGPDGMTVDEEGCIWSARFGGGAVVRYDPQGRELQRLRVPASRVTSVIFGGPEMDQLFVTTAGGAEREGKDAVDGALFRARPGVRGQVEFRSRAGR
jgi:D-xylonolactonase